MNFRHWFHHLFNPHCEDCRLDKLQSAVCLSCEVLKAQLEISNLERMKLLEAILQKPDNSIPVQEETPQPIKPTYIPWRVRQQMLEAQDRILKENKVNEGIVRENKRQEILRAEKEVSSVSKPPDLTVEEIEKELLDATPGKTESAA